MTAPPAHASSSRVQPLIALAHLVVAAAAVGVVLVLLYAGTRPNAELEGGYAVVGGMLVLPVLTFAAAAVACAVARSKAPRRSLRLSIALACVELVTAILLAWAAWVAVASYGEFAPWRSPVVVPALLLGAAGTAALAQARRAPRQP
ncbi:hypothetical protein N864_05935 [Intrasporangium chromatireducens Q5-1]|uniref:Uncharacterized protein n=1 Tax=Intrasporangium chromatireducens Q5-1 TaxID=584657 RepID=W9GMX5_9MICO|nr:hypothetical protein [Intrasporangium chromatireducens]EWT05249.1 hypothetical protein N864_05935 [Intrasporangium chromatireducens Q5-1]